MPPNIPQEVPALAREIVDRELLYSSILSRHLSVKAAAFAIMEVTERAASFVEDGASCGTWGCGHEWLRDNSATALRNWEHLKQ